MMVANLLYLTAQTVDLRHLRNFALHEIEALRDQCPVVRELLRDNEWYDLMYQGEEQLAALGEVRTGDTERIAAEQAVYEGLFDLYKTVCSGKLDTYKYMGKGSCRVIIMFFSFC